MLKNLSFFLKLHFFPHQSNNYKAKALHHPSIVLYISLLLLFQSFYIAVKKMGPEILGYATNINTDRILELVNTERQKENLNPLVISMQLNDAAEKKAADMLEKNYWAHISPTGTTPWQFITGSGYNYIYAGENLAKSFDTSDEVVRAWLKSPTHRANLLKPEYSEIGLAVKNGVLDGEETTLVVQEFGSKERPYLASAPVKQLPEEENPQLPGAEEIKTSLPQSAGMEISGEVIKKPQLKLSRSLSLLIAEILMVILLIDSIFIYKHKTVRISGHSLAHIMFLIALLGAMGATGIGAVL